MAGNELLTREESFKNTLNASKIDTKDSKKFLLYFGEILQLAVSAGLINENERNLIGNTITREIEIETEDPDDEFAINYVQIRNFMYLVSAYIHSLSNWDAWTELRTIRTNKDASELIYNAKSWLNRKLTKALLILDRSKSVVKSLNLDNVTNAYQELVLLTKKATNSTSDSTNLDLMIYHEMVLGSGTYMLMEEDRLENSADFFEKLCKTIQSFCMEISIMSKINAKEVVRLKKVEVDEFYSDSQNRIDEVDEFYKGKLADLKEEYDKKLKRCKDRVKLEREYDEAKSRLQEEWEDKINSLEHQLENDELAQIEVLSGTYTLYDLVKEYAIYSLASKQKIVYPSTLIERNEMIMKLDIKLAITEFISGNENVLTSEELEFLKSLIKK